jgi:Phage integrase family
MSGETKLLAALLYGTGLRLLEGLHLRVKDVDFEQRALVTNDSSAGAAGLMFRLDARGHARIGCLREPVAPFPQQVCHRRMLDRDGMHEGVSC